MMAITRIVFFLVSVYCSTTKGQRCNAPTFSCQYNNPCDPLCFPGQHLYPGSSSRKYVECDDGECSEQMCPRRSNWNQANLRCEGGNGMEARCAFGKFDCESRNPCSPTLCESGIEKYPGSSPRWYVSCTDGCAREQCPRRQVWDQEKQRCVRKPIPCPDGQTYNEETSQCEVDWTECWEEVTVDDIPADCYTATEDEDALFDTRDIETIYASFDARSHCGARSESRYLYTKPADGSVNPDNVAISCFTDHGICLPAHFLVNSHLRLLFIEIDEDGLWFQIRPEEMAYDEDCSGDGLVSYWGNGFDACADGGGKYLFGRVADIQASCYPNIECTLPTEDQTVYRKRTACIST